MQLRLHQHSLLIGQLLLVLLLLVVLLILVGILGHLTPLHLFASGGGGNIHGPVAGGGSLIH